MLLGRDRELAEIGESLATNRAVGVVGEAGVGKSVLVREAAHASGRQMLEGGGLSALSWMEHLPLVRAMGRTLPERDSAGLAAFVAEEVGDGVLLLDDLHWADGATMRVLRFLVGRVGLVCGVRRGDPGAGPRVRQLHEAGVDLLDLEGLTAPDAAALIRNQRSDLADDAVERIVHAAHGNPLLLEQLALGNGSLDALRLGLGARLRPHSAAARKAVARLAILGRPGERELIGDQLDELLRAGLLVERDGRVELRHQLLGDAALETLESPEVQRLHSELAPALADPGEAARHHLDAGELNAAYEKALEAAAKSTSRGEHASHLKIAAFSAAGPDADRLRLAAAEALVEAGDYSAALELTAELREADPKTRARILLAETRAWRQLGDRPAAERALAAGLDTARGSLTAAEVGLLLEEVAILIHDWDSAALPHAAAALDLARSVGTAQARAQLMFAFAVGDHESAALGLEHARDALEMARDEGDGSLECEAAHVLADCLITAGRASDAYPLVIAMVERARELGLRSREFELLNVQAYLELHVRGDVEKANELCRLLLREPVVLGSHECRTHAYLAFGLALLGGDREATEILDEAARGAITADDRAAVASGRAEVELLAGRYTTALAAAQECMNEDTPFAWQATRLAAWAAFELGQDQPPRPDEPPPEVTAACVPEVHALSSLADGRSAEAEELFREAAGAWQGSFVQGELRCLLGVGLSALQGGAGERAREALLEAERMARRGGFEPLLAHIRRSLRQAGVTAAAPRRRASGLLTGREREVLDLVGAGLRTREIAARLGVAPSTVDSQVKSAMRKLGTRTRAQAVMQAADETA